MVRMSRLRELFAWSRQGAVAAPLLAALMIALLIVEFARPRQEVARNQATADSASARRDSSAPEPGFIDVPIPLRPASGAALNGPLDAGEQLVVEKGVEGNTALLGASVTAKRVTISPLASGEGSALAGPLSFETDIAVDAVQIATIGREPVAFAIGNRGATAVVEKHDLTGSGRLLDSAGSRPIKRARGGSREARIATWSGSEPDLFLIDRGLADGTMAVRVLSGESGYRKVLLDVEVPKAAGFPPGQWQMDVGLIDGEKPDILLVTATPRTPSGSTEVHVLSGEQKYSRFLMQVTSVLPARPSARRTALGYRDGSPTWFSAIVGSRRLEPFRLRAPKRRTSRAESRVSPSR